MPIVFFDIQYLSTSRFLAKKFANIHQPKTVCHVEPKTIVFHNPFHSSTDIPIPSFIFSIFCLFSLFAHVQLKYGRFYSVYTYSYKNLFFFLTLILKFSNSNSHHCYQRSEKIGGAKVQFFMLDSLVRAQTYKRCLLFTYMYAKFLRIGENGR